MTFATHHARTAAGSIREAPAGTPHPSTQAARWLWAAAALGVSGATAAAVSGMTALIVYRASRPRGVWGTDDPPDGVAEDVEFTSLDGTLIRGWLLSAPERTPAPTLVLCHGVWTGRRECLPLALRFREADYNVLVFDFRAHGTSDGRHISIGLNETLDVQGAVTFLKQRPEVDAGRIGVVGFSMGAASAIRAAADCPDIAAVVADSAYASFVDAVRHSFRQVVHFPHYPFGPLAMRWAKWIVHVDPAQLRPVDIVARIAPRPILIVHGQEDEIVPVRHAYLLFKAAQEPKDLWIAPRAHHVGARDVYPEEYFTRIERFLHDALAGSAAAAGGARAT